MHYPDIDPVIFELGPLAVRWYGLAYLAAFATCWWLSVRRARRPGSGWTAEQVSDLVFYGAVGAVLGGRVGFTLFYAFQDWLADPLLVLRIWDGGMSFHGGMLGAMAGIWWFGRQAGKGFFQVTDFVAPAVPPGLGFGRLGNFANTELPGRVTELPWGLIYPCDADAIRPLNPLCLGQWESFARHPSPLYQAAAEGLLLFVLLWLVARSPRATGVVSGAFLSGYGALRFLTEFFREPDPDKGFIAFGWLTMGQALSLPMVLVGILLMVWAQRRRQIH